MLTDLMARVMVKVECCGRSVRGDNVIVQRDAQVRHRLHYRCTDCAAP